ncbi:MAG: hypothetical protein IJX54_05065, partial [Oscillospiraceae bacterium]|nr:hypothetical protein [Oscillospiraceae bacterium]
MNFMNIIAALAALIPTLAETAANDPTAIFSVLNEYGIIEMIQNYIQEHPLMTVVITALVTCFLDTIVILVIDAAVIMFAIEAF